MIETEKMLQLRRYVTFLRAGTKSRIVNSHLSSTSPRLTFHKVSSLATRKNDIYRYVHQGPSRLQMHLQSCGNSSARCIRMLSTMIPQSSIDDVDHKLMLLCDDVKKGRISADSLKEVIRLCDETGYQLHHDTSVLLLKCCGNLLPDLETTERQYLADQVWRLAKRNSKGLTLEHYNTLLDIHTENLSSIDPKKFLADMNVEPDKDTYCLLLNAAATIGSNDHLLDVISLMKEKDVVIDEDVFNALVQTYVNNGNMSQAEHIITLMQDAKLPTDTAYAELACGYAKLDNIPNLVKILNDEPQSAANLLKLIKVLSISNNGRHIPVVLNYLMFSAPDIKSQISKTITELIRTDRITDAHTIINCFVMNDATKDIAKIFANCFLNELVMLNMPIDDITTYASDFMASGCEPLALTNVAESSLKLGRENQCLAIFKAMREKGVEVRSHYYWPLLSIAHYDKGEAKILSLVKHMIDTEVELNSDTLLNYVYPYINTANPIIALQKILIKGVPGSIAYTPLISFLLLQNRLQDIISLSTNSKQFRIYYKELMKPLVRAYIATKDVKTCVFLLTIFPYGQYFAALFLKMVLRNKQLKHPVNDLQEFLKEFQICHIKISQHDATILKRFLSNINFKNINNVSIFKSIDELVDENRIESAFLSHPMFMNTEDLTCYMVEMKSKSVVPRSILRYLLDAYCAENNLKKVEKIKREMDIYGYEWTNGMKMYLFQIYVKHGKLREAELLLSDLRKSDNFQIDNVKIIKYAIALVNADKPKKAFEIINNIKNVNLRPDAQNECSKFLYILAQSKYDSYTKDMFHLLYQKRYININTELLRPLIMIPLKYDDIQGAVNIFITCAEKYRKAPLALELLIALLQQKDTSKLYDTEKNIKKIYDILVEFYGTSSANTWLVLALAKLNKTEQVRAVLQNEKLSMDCLTHYFNYARRSNNIDSLKNLFKILSDDDNVERVLLAKMLLSIYSKTGDINNALELWKLMCEKNIKPDEKFKNIFSEFLVSNKVPLPPEFEQDMNEINVSN